MLACVLECVGVSARARDRACARVASLVQRATRMRHIVTSFVASMVPPYFSTLSHKRCHFREKLPNIKYGF